MRLIRCGFLLATVALISLATYSASAADQLPGVSGPRVIELQTFEQVNDYRKANGLDPLVWNDAIAREARLHSRDMADGDCSFGHDGFDDRVADLRDTFASLSGAGENVLFTSETVNLPERAVQLWLHSPHHLKNIRGDYNFSGLGVWQDSKGLMYFTQIFIKDLPVAKATSATVSPAG